MQKCLLLPGLYYLSCDLWLEFFTFKGTDADFEISDNKVDEILNNKKVSVIVFISVP